MNDAVALTPGQRRLVGEILQRHLPPTAQVWVFGSRAHHEVADPGADLDLLVDAGRRITLAERSGLETDFEYSTLSYRVDVVDAWSMSGVFSENVVRERILFLKARV